MHVCIAGWYYDPDLLGLMKKVNERHDVHIVGHREGDSHGLPVTQIENKGLEFGCYSYYLENIWTGNQNVLFMHDDLKIAPVLVNYEIIPATNIFNKMAELQCDQAYFFQNEDDAAWNGYKHGRMIYMSARLLRYLKENGGIWYDKDNDGKTTTGPYNAGIFHFHEQMMSLNGKFNIANCIYVPAITMLRRNGAVANTLDAVVGGN